MESSKFEVGDMVEAYNGDIIGWVTYINYQKE